MAGWSARDLSDPARLKVEPIFPHHGAMYETVFAPSWWMVLVPGAAALGLTFTGLLRGNRKLWLPGLVAALVVLIWFLVARAIATPVEQSLKGTRDMVDGVVAGDRGKIDAVLHPTRAVAERWSRQTILAKASSEAKTVGVTTARITGTTVSQQPPDTVVVNFRVLTQIEVRGTGFSGMLRSDWQFEFIPDSEGRYRLSVIRLMGIEDNAQLTETVRRVMQKP